MNLSFFINNFRLKSNHQPSALSQVEVEMSVSKLSSPERSESLVLATADISSGGPGGPGPPPPRLRQFVLRNRLLFHLMFRLRKSREAARKSGKKEEEMVQEEEEDNDESQAMDDGESGLVIESEIDP